MIKLTSILNKFHGFCKGGGLYWILVSYIVWSLSYYIFFICRKQQTYSFLDFHLGEGFAISFSASFLESLLTFLFVGMVVTIVSLIVNSKRPDEYDFDVRVGAILNSDFAQGDNNLRTYLKRETQKLACFNDKILAEVFIEDFDVENCAYKVYTELEHTISNALKDRNFSVTDKPEVEVASDLEVNGSYGYIKELKTFDIKTQRTIRSFIGKSIEYLKMPRFSREIDIAIKKNCQLGWKMSYCVWHKVWGAYGKKEKYTISVSRYTKKTDFQLINSYSADVEFELFLYSHEKKNSNLIQKKTKVASGGHFYYKKSHIMHPLDRFELYLHEQPK